MPWYVRSFTAASALIVTIFGTAFIIAPMKMIKTVSLVSNPAAPGRILLRIQPRSSVPFQTRFDANKVMEAHLNEVSLDDKVFAEDLSYKNVPVENAQDFTDAILKPTKTSNEARFRGSQSSIVNIWPTLRQNIRRMFVRDEMAYVRVEGRSGTWKLDLHNALVVDNALPLAAAMTPVDMDRSFFRWLREAAQFGRMFGR